MGHIEAVLFDVDGVLVQSEEANAGFFGDVVEAAGYARPDRAAIDACFHLTMRDALRQLVPDANEAEVDRMWGIGNGVDLVYPSQLLEFPDQLVPVLDELRASYTALGIVTGRVRSGVQVLYDVRPDIAGFFDVEVVAEDYTRPKPDPEPLQIALARLNLRADQAVYIGDSATDILAAAAIGMPSVHLAARMHPEATVGITDFAEIPAAVARIALGPRQGVGSEAV